MYIPSEIKLTIDDIYKGKQVSPDELSEIYDTYIIIAYNSGEKSSKGEIVFIGKEQNEEYDSWFKQKRPITPVFNNREELEDMSVYDE